MVLQQCRYHHLHACVPVWTQSCSGITKKNHSSARLRLSASKHFRVGSNLLPLVHTCELSTLGLLGQLKKKTLKPKRQWNTTKEQIKSRQVTLPIIACAKAHFFQNFIFSILFFFFFPPPDYGEMSWWLNWNKNLFLQFCFYTSIFVIFGWVLSGQNISEQAPADGKWLRWLEYFATTLLLESKVPSSEQVTIYVSILSLEPVHSLLHSS